MMYYKISPNIRPSGLILVLFLVLVTLTMCEEEGVIDPEEVDIWKQYTTQHGLSSNELWSVSEDLYGNIWAGTSTGLHRLEGDTWIQVGQNYGVSGYRIYDIEMDGAGNLWAGSWYGVDINVQGNWFWYDSLFNDAIHVNCLYRDNKGDMWIGTYGDETIRGGLFRADGAYFYEYPYFQQPGFNHIYSITGDQSGNIWIGTDAGGVKLTATDGTIYNSENKLNYDDVTAIHVDDWNDVWFGTLYGTQVGRLHGNDVEFFSLYHNYPVSGVINITEDKDHNIWIGTTFGLIKYNGTLMDPAVKPELSGIPIPCALNDESGRVWFGTEEQGLFVYVPK
jgi:ligand-binding sensor domain-containing protein